MKTEIELRNARKKDLKVMQNEVIRARRQLYRSFCSSVPLPSLSSLFAKTIEADIATAPVPADRAVTLFYAIFPIRELWENENLFIEFMLKSLEHKIEILLILETKLMGELRVIWKIESFERRRI